MKEISNNPKVHNVIGSLHWEKMIFRYSHSLLLDLIDFCHLRQHFDNLRGIDCQRIKKAINYLDSFLDFFPYHLNRVFIPPIHRFIVKVLIQYGALGV